MKTTYEKWIEANQKLIACMDGISHDKWSKYSPVEQSAICTKDKLAVSAFLKNNSISFKNLLQERIQATSGSAHDHESSDRHHHHHQ